LPARRRPFALLAHILNDGVDSNVPVRRPRQGIHHRFKLRQFDDDPRLPAVVLAEIIAARRRRLLMRSRQRSSPPTSLHRLFSLAAE
jgi:hypothetical protein